MNETILDVCHTLSLRIQDLDFQRLEIQKERTTLKKALTILQKQNRKEQRDEIRKNKPVIEKKKYYRVGDYTPNNLTIIENNELQSQTENQKELLQTVGKKDNRYCGSQDN